MISELPSSSLRSRDFGFVLVGFVQGSAEYLYPRFKIPGLTVRPAAPIAPARCFESGSVLAFCCWYCSGLGCVWLLSAQDT